MVIATNIAITGIEHLLSYRTAGQFYADIYPSRAGAVFIVLSAITIYGAVYTGFPRLIAARDMKVTLMSSVVALSSGALLSIIAVFTSKANNIFQALLVSRISSSSGLASLALMVVALPLIGELVFRGIILRTLAEAVARPAAILATSLLFAYIWPLFDPYTRLCFSFIASLMFLWTGRLIEPVLVSLSFNIGALALVFLRIAR